MSEENKIGHMLAVSTFACMPRAEAQNVKPERIRGDRPQVRGHQTMKRLLALTLVATASIGLATTASAEPLRIRGTIVATSSDSLTVHTVNGNVTASLNDKTGFVSVVPSNLNSVGPGSYLGVASKDGGGRRIALSVIVFPPEMKGAAEGNAKYDPLPDTTLSGGAPTASSMTNANVKAISSNKDAPRVNSTMTNASVATATAKSDVKYVTLAYKGGEQKVLIPPTAPVVAFVPGAASISNTGAHAFVLADSTNGKITAGLVAVGANGLTPPF
ncbi:hypothetical protein GCM10007874_19030 [Labrys miyagiensis]|uniref:DUF5666 domain-containing protein n=1 Tax=Labrys miyagiensis TaxID=346912 RepID=A0ABQ6CF43_9HYPH|nr:metal ABC transporter permease [Labrys miyagiensis]GLS18886.1 hypothetical protein GCM10007874_19030 [Labrys miyagiensis]